ncbi:response regulator [Poritiphilus flavus]|uniref:Response regulator n=1 Tax=Poritiphilus flavus TaxID=2697053 RepID=A0A6L9EHP2_9FLAO|nr:response regulator transcription factor [Poritiphilus flavus]NAS14294.1 response regulator [Poritiphilus flavus]
MIHLAIAEDHQALIDGIASYIEFEDDIALVGYANDGEELLKLVKQKEPQVILCDIRMPKIDGIEVTKKILAMRPLTRVVAFTMFDQEEAIKQMLDAGAVGYILKSSSLKIVLEAIRSVAGGNTYFDKKIHLPVADKNHSKSILSSREKQILGLIGRGKTSSEIADELYIGKSTVDTHRKNMIRKLGLSGPGELLRYAVEKKYDF